jgi:hypothetical protein
MDATLSEPIDVSSYPLATSSTPAWSVTDDDEVLVNHANQTGSLVLRTGSFSGVETHVAPAHEHVDALDEIRVHTNPASTVTEGEQLVFELRASGVAGELSLTNAGASDLEDGTGLDLSMTASESEPNSATPTLSVADSDATLVTDTANDTYYLVLDTGAAETDQGALEHGSYDVTAEITGDHTARYETLDGSATVAYEPRAASFANDGEIPLTADDAATVTAETNLSPGSRVELRLEADDQIHVQTVDVGNDGTATATFDLVNAAVGEEYRAELRVGGSVLKASTVITADESSATETATPNETTTTASDADESDGQTTTATATATEVSTTTATPAEEEVAASQATVADDSTTSETETDDTTSGSGPGMGVLVAVLAVVVGVVARRRL